MEKADACFLCGRNEDIEVYLIGSYKKKDSFAMSCMRCHIELHGLDGETKEELVKRWNSRAVPSLDQMQEFAVAYAPNEVYTDEDLHDWRKSCT